MTSGQDSTSREGHEKWGTQTIGRPRARSGRGEEDETSYGSQREELIGGREGWCGLPLQICGKQLVK